MADAETTTDNTGKYPFITYSLANIFDAASLLDQDDLKLKSDLDDGTGRIGLYDVYRDWYGGEHGAVLSDRQAELFEASGIPFSDNFTDQIVDAATRRLKPTGYSFTPESDIATDAVEAIHKRNRMDLGYARVHHNAIKLGDAFVICDFDTDTNEATITYNRPDYMRPEYDDNGVMLWASKKWQTDRVSPFNPEGDDIYRMNVYYPDRIEKFYTAEDGGDWLPYMDSTDLLWPVPWINESTSEPLGIPVFHFRNRHVDEDFGVSEIRKAIPQQALLNKSVLDLDLVMDTQGYPQRYAAGIDTTENADGQQVPVELPSGPGETWVTENENAKFGQFAPAEVAGALAAIEMVTLHMSASNATPIHDMIAGNKSASGESLKMKDSGLGDKVEEKQTGFGNTWEDVILYCFKLRNVFGQGLPAIDTDILSADMNWKDTAPRNEKTMVEVLVAMVRDLGASQEWALEQFGVEGVREVLEQAQAEKDAASERMLRSITMGTDTVDDEVDRIDNDDA